MSDYARPFACIGQQIHSPKSDRATQLRNPQQSGRDARLKQSELKESRTHNVALIKAVTRAQKQLSFQVCHRLWLFQPEQSSIARNLNSYIVLDDKYSTEGSGARTLGITTSRRQIKCYD